MNNLYQQFEQLIAQNDYTKAASLAENALKEMPLTAFHKVIGRDLLHLTEKSASAISHVFTKAQKKITVKAMYFEMNAFSVNTDIWFFDSFAFSFCGNPNDPEDTDWLADDDFYMLDTLQITGFEDLQEACKDHLDNERYEDEIQRNALYAFEPIVTIRFIELLAHAVQYAKVNNLAWKDIPIFGTSHDESLLYQSSKRMDL